MSVRIRSEQADDIVHIHDVIVAAFLKAPHADHTEQFIVRELRRLGALTISLVAEEDGLLVGHVALSPVRISDGANNWYGLGPISVLPERQGNGIGSQLMNSAIQQLKQIEAKGCVLLGDPKFYNRFGFAPRKGLVLSGVPEEYFLALLLEGDLPQGEVFYHKAFLATDYQ
ncbi:GNAT family N-acetyltransferase [Aestuariibacter salexigens]|uniref:GNAT family N-acetyltransferase n=1 Tax=Aestuariibacter salexigens TaxID=226010 RepID=UPI0004796B3C|nr:N-acetyltransferase [Aestuariibacter salexigens]